MAILPSTYKDTQNSMYPFNERPEYERYEKIDCMMDVLRDISIRLSDLEHNVQNINNRLSILEDKDLLSDEYVEPLDEYLR